VQHGCHCEQEVPSGTQVVERQAQLVEVLVQDCDGGCPGGGVTAQTFPVQHACVAEQVTAVGEHCCVGGTSQ
jgi:hypothetical protein